MTMITPSYLGETIEYSSLHACRSTLEDPTYGCEGKQPSGTYRQCQVASKDMIFVFGAMGFIQGDLNS